MNRLIRYVTISVKSPRWREREREGKKKHDEGGDTISTADFQTLPGLFVLHSTQRGEGEVLV